VGSRDDALAALEADDAAEAADAAHALIEHPEWRTGRAPDALIERLVDPRLSLENAFLDLARLWPRQELSPALVAAFGAAQDPERRERAALRAKDLAGEEEVPQLLAAAQRSDEPPAVRRWLLEAVDRLAYGRDPAWQGVGAALEQLAGDPAPLVRDGAVAIAGSLEDSPAQRAFLMRMLDDHDTYVLTSSLTALGERGVRRSELASPVSERLESHADPRVRNAYDRLNP
jgi:hypothetical protein